MDLAVPLALRGRRIGGLRFQTYLKGCGLQLRFIGANSYALFDLADIDDYGATQQTQEFVFIGQSGLMEILPAWRGIIYCSGLRTQ